MMGAVSERRYLSIGEVLAQLQEEFPDVTISKIRFLESQGLIDPERTPSGYRKFYDTDIERLRFILREQREHFLPLKVIRDRLDSDPETTVDATVEPPVVPPLAFVPPTPPAVEAVAPPTRPAPSPAQAEAPAERVPIWMQRTTPRVASLLAEPTTVSLTFEELCVTSGLSDSELRQVEQYGLITGRAVGRATFYDEHAVVAAKIAARFLRHGIEPRHLKMYKNAAEREAGLIEQVILPLLKQRNPAARAQALDNLQTLARLGGELRDVMLRQAVRPFTDGV